MKKCFIITCITAVVLVAGGVGLYFLLNDDQDVHEIDFNSGDENTKEPTEKQIERWTKEFEKADTDGDDSLTMREFEQYTCNDGKIKSLCDGDKWKDTLSIIFIKTTFEVADKDEDGELVVNEWISTMVILENKGIISQTEEPETPEPEVENKDTEESKAIKELLLNIDFLN